MTAAESWDGTDADSTQTGRRPKKAELVARAIVEELSTDRATPGSVLDVEDELMRRLDVSRATLRQGLRLLEMFGVVESRLGRAGGIVVHEPEAEDFARVVTLFLECARCTYRHLIEVYAEVRPVVAGNAAANGSDEDLARLGEALAEIERLPIGQQVRRTRLVNDLLIGMVDNPIWELVAQSIQHVISGHIERLLIPADKWPDATASLRGVVEAVMDRDVARAERLAHLQIAAWLTIADDRQPGLLDTPILWSR